MATKEIPALTLALDNSGFIAHYEYKSLLWNVKYKAERRAERLALDLINREIGVDDFKARQTDKYLLQYCTSIVSQDVIQEREGFEPPFNRDNAVILAHLFNEYRLRYLESLEGHIENYWNDNMDPDVPLDWIYDQCRGTAEEDLDIKLVASHYCDNIDRPTLTVLDGDS